jgi:hypothetical protein
MAPYVIHGCSLYTVTVFASMKIVHSVMDQETVDCQLSQDLIWERFYTGEVNQKDGICGLNKWKIQNINDLCVFLRKSKL